MRAEARPSVRDDRGWGSGRDDAVRRLKAVATPGGRGAFVLGRDGRISTAELMAAVLGLPMLAEATLDEALRTLDGRGMPATGEIPLIEIGHGPEGPMVAVAVTAKTAGRLAVLLGRNPGLRRRIRLVDPEALGAAFARIRSQKGRCPARANLRRVAVGDVDDMLAGLVAASGDRLARRAATRGQVMLLALLSAAVLAGVALAPRVVFDLANIAMCIGFLAQAALRETARRLLAKGGFQPPMPPRDEGAPGALPPEKLPVYTVLVPLRDEAAVVSRLLLHISALRYPRDRLDIKLLVEDDDIATLHALARRKLGPPFEIVMVPRCGPLTKPKALGVGLVHARGELVTVFDAEDRPDRNQLLDAAAAFAAGGPRLGCVQARLCIDHGGDAWITGLFAIEYAMLFDGVLPLLAHADLPFLLGGTSNHFRLSVLRRLGGWDAWNVTEDADLAVRIAHAGYRSTVIASTTYEEAPLTLRAWLRQRGRWQKGWLQTWMVHMRAPVGLWRALGARGFIALQIQFFGGLFANAVLPLWLVLAGLTLMGRPVAGPDGSFRGDIGFTLAIAALLLGYATAVSLAVAVLKARPIGVSPRLLFGWPIYTLLLSLSMLRATWEWLRRPHHWAKTAHGLARRPVRPPRL